MGEVAKDLTAGTVRGAAQLIVGHPFDTIKVKLQGQPAPLPGQPPKVLRCNGCEGPRGLYKGMGAPLATVAAFNAVLFSVRGQMEGLLRFEPGAPLTVSQQVVCGAGAGVVSFLACPTELINCSVFDLVRHHSLISPERYIVAIDILVFLSFTFDAAHIKLAVCVGMAQKRLLTSPAFASVGRRVKYGGPMDVARHVLSEAGVKGPFKGLVPTLAREVPGNAAMFWCLGSTQAELPSGFPSTQQTLLRVLVKWMTTRNPKFSSSMDALRRILVAEGAKGLYKGFGPTMARSVPANASCFLAYEVTRTDKGILQMRTAGNVCFLPERTCPPSLSLFTTILICSAKTVYRVGAPIGCSGYSQNPPMQGNPGETICPANPNSTPKLDFSLEATQNNVWYGTKLTGCEVSWDTPPRNEVPALMPRTSKSSNRQNKTTFPRQGNNPSLVEIMAADQIGSGLTDKDDRSRKEKKKAMKKAVFKQQTRTSGGEEHIHWAKESNPFQVFEPYGSEEVDENSMYVTDCAPRNSHGARKRTLTREPHEEIKVVSCVRYTCTHTNRWPPWPADRLRTSPHCLACLVA
ncbi:hypothetical protein Ancab_032997 [Ancistrocladus abbreviatus]